MNTAVSVVIPTYARPEKVVRAVNSALGQSYENIEVIVVDDNPPDSEARTKTEEVMGQYENDSRVVYIRHDRNRNGAAARNTGIRAARGDFIAFLDDDDIFLPDKLKTQAEFLERHPEYGGVYGGYREKGRDFQYNVTGDLTERLLMCESVAPTPTLLLRREKLLEIGGFNENYRRHQDIEMLIRFCEKNKMAPVEKIVAEIGFSGGKNNLHCEELEKLKNDFLSDFAGAVEKQPAAVRKRIYCKNYSAVWADYLHRKRFRDSLRIYFTWASKYPVCFTSECFKRIGKHLRIMSKLKNQNGGD